MLGLIVYKIAELIAVTTPYPLSYFISNVSAKIWFLTRLNVGATKNNVSNVLNLDKNSKEVGRITKTIFINWAKNIVDFLKHPVISKEKLKQRVEIVGLENLDEALKKGKGVVIFTAHIGNFEWGACRLAVEGYKIWGVSLVRKSSRLNKFFEARRLSKGVKTLYVNKMLHVFKILRNNEIVAIPTDWDPGARATPFNLFGKKAYLPNGPVHIALMSGAALIPSFIIRKGKYNHYQVIGEPIKLCAEGDKKTLISKNMGKMVEVLEKYIKDNIVEWEMFHNIWDEE